jgi:hypothetical protein
MIKKSYQVRFTVSLIGDIIPKNDHNRRNFPVIESISFLQGTTHKNTDS